MTLTATPAIPVFPTRQAWATLLLTAAIAAGVAAGLTVASGDSEQLPTLAATGVACLVASLLGLEPVRRLPRWGAGHAVSACMLGMVVRLAASAAGCVAAAKTLNLPPRQVAVWALLWYVVLLIAEVRVLVRYFNGLTAPALSEKR